MAVEGSALREILAGLIVVFGSALAALLLIVVFRTPQMKARLSALQREALEATVFAVVAVLILGFALEFTTIEWIAAIPAAGIFIVGLPLVSHYMQARRLKRGPSVVPTSGTENEGKSSPRSERGPPYKGIRLIAATVFVLTSAVFVTGGLLASSFLLVPLGLGLGATGAALILLQWVVGRRAMEEQGLHW